MSQQIFQVAGVELREVPVEDFLERERRRRADVEASIIRPAAPIREPPDIDALLTDVRQARLADRKAQRELEAKAEAVSRAAELADSARERLAGIAAIEAQHIDALSAATKDWLAAGGVGHQPVISPAANVSSARSERAAVEAELKAYQDAHAALASELEAAQRTADEARGKLNAAAKRVIAAEATDKALLYLRFIEEAAALHAELQITALQHFPEIVGRPASPLMFDSLSADVVNNPGHTIDHRDVAPQTMVARTRAVADAVHGRFRELIADPPEVEAEAAE